MEFNNSLFNYFGFVAIIALFAAMLELAFQQFMYPNMFFYPWGVFLVKMAKKNEVWRHISRFLGRCRYCNGTWIGIYMYLYFFDFDIKVLFVVAATFVFLRILSDYVITDIDSNFAVEESMRIEVTHDATPVKPMLISYLILGGFYATVYIVLPFVFDKFLG